MVRPLSTPFGDASGGLFSVKPEEEREEVLIVTEREVVGALNS